jgi:hypothetical protein
MIEKASHALLMVIGLVVLVLALGLYAQRQINGPLRFKPGQVPAARHPAGDLVVSWDPAGGGQLVIFHQAHPERLLWASLPGRGFVAAPLGQPGAFYREGSPVADQFVANLQDAGVLD